jgi:hypothetical protein
MGHTVAGFFEGEGSVAEVAIASLGVALGLLGIWRAARLSVMIDAQGIHVRNLTGRDQHLRWDAVASVDCGVIDHRVGVPLHGPIISFHELGREAIAVPALGSYSRPDAERKVALLRSLEPQDAHDG